LSGYAAANRKIKDKECRNRQTYRGFFNIFPQNFFLSQLFSGEFVKTYNLNTTQKTHLINLICFGKHFGWSAFLLFDPWVF